MPLSKAASSMEEEVEKDEKDSVGSSIWLIIIIIPDNIFGARICE